ncbi:Glycerol-3-phosphate acyltransferase, chloroplastic [Porphyridium purpureum]|uniref:Glycerol-3-phosphate acyltransferase, chloroplastic n=1 Tax=Porphyridium purpureum TaxID=35688 RepID=A0A5J4YFT7_PORPP|nr:Glycerol-3-phosphate acyltransferase, chloroplastic [Porphyridium purpureum]|eukprot:POR0667..scf269_36
MRALAGFACAPTQSLCRGTDGWIATGRKKYCETRRRGRVAGAAARCATSRRQSKAWMMTAAGGSVAPSLQDTVAGLVKSGSLSESYAAVLAQWHGSYQSAALESGMFKRAEDGAPDAEAVRQFTDKMFGTLLKLVAKQMKDPYPFESYHKMLVEPFDYYSFGVQFARPLVDFANSQILGMENLQRAAQQLASGENVIFFANHQSEGDPHAVDVLLAELAGLPDLAQNMIFMAGDRVREDPLVVPFSLGRNLLTVYSKKHINDVPELRSQKQNHNRRTIVETQNLLAQGGKCIWFAPSGGRDRRSAATRKVEVAPFDPDAIEMMRLTAMKAAGKPTHFYTMALATYALLPPPDTVDKALGEARVVKFTPLKLAVGSEIDLATCVPEEEAKSLDKHQLRVARAAKITEITALDYAVIGGYEQ